MKLKNFGIVIALLIFSNNIGLSQTEIEWMTWEEAMHKNEVEPRKFFVDIYTDWCTWCKKMDVATFQQEEVAAYLNANYYPIKFDGETKRTIKIKDKEYKFVKNGRHGHHTLAAALTQGKLSYPTVVFLDEDLRLIQSLQGFYGPEEFRMFCAYYANDYYKTTPWRKFASNYSN